MMTVGSLFAGIGGFDLGFERAGFEIRWQVEIDPFCRKVLEKHWPEVRRYEDVRTVGNELEHVDIICGGFPCQDLSTAGKREGLNGARSGLYTELIRIVEGLRPRGVVIENVHHSWRRWVPVLRRALWTLGYASLPIRLRAADFGAWHERRRVFLVAHLDASVLRLESWRRGWPFWEVSPLFADAAEVRHDEPRARDGRGHAEAVARHDGCARHTADTDSPRCEDDCGCGEDARQPRNRSTRADVACTGAGELPNADTDRQLQPQGLLSDESGWARDSYRWPAEPDVVRVVHGVPSRAYGRWLSDRVASLGNAVIPIEAQWIAERIKDAEGLR